MVSSFTEIILIEYFLATPPLRVVVLINVFRFVHFDLLSDAEDQNLLDPGH